MYLSAGKLFPGMQIIGNKKTVGLLEDFYNLKENVRVIGDGDEIDLGRFKLKFFITPMVHWPEAMMTYETTTGTLFSGDVFGGFATLDNGIFDDEIGDLAYHEDETLRYKHFVKCPLQLSSEMLSRCED